MKPSPPTETNDSCRVAPAGVFVFVGDVDRSFGHMSVVWCAMLIRWILRGPPPPPPAWGTKTDDKCEESGEQ